ncbi:MAG: hypothetical protein HC841_07925 [Verrucomicrobiae bacterium]|nr:hypothetical protein [Verrucomicrobiae bacterium]
MTYGDPSGPFPYIQISGTGRPVGIEQHFDGNGARLVYDGARHSGSRAARPPVSACSRPMDP